ncbi:hypothetical protein KR018_008068 [Drosophila ironensis]|nr:hypothetical protein KR018_008068 [Drosophila ironensis]
MDHSVINQKSWMKSKYTICKTCKCVPHYIYKNKKMLVSVSYNKKLHEKLKNKPTIYIADDMIGNPQSDATIYNDDDMNGNPQSDAANRPQQDLPEEDGTPGSVYKPIPLRTVDLSQCLTEKSLKKICRKKKHPNRRS